MTGKELISTDQAYFCSAWDLNNHKQLNKIIMEEKNMTSNEDIWEVAMANGAKLTALSDRIELLTDFISSKFRELAVPVKLLVDSSKKPSVGSSTPTPEAVHFVKGVASAPKAQPIAKPPAKKEGGTFMESIDAKIAAAKAKGYDSPFVSPGQLAIIEKIRADETKKDPWLGVEFKIFNKEGS